MTDAIIAEYQQVCEQIKMLETLKDKLSKEIKASVKPDVETQIGSFIVKNTSVFSTRFNATQFKTDHLALYTQYNNQIVVSERLTIKKTVTTAFK